MFVSVLVKKGLSLYRTQAKTLKVSLSEMEELKQKFKDLPRSNLEKLKELHPGVFSKLK